MCVGVCAMYFFLNDKAAVAEALHDKSCPRIRKTLASCTGVSCSDVE